jgi:hypothetical protein
MGSLATKSRRSNSVVQNVVMEDQDDTEKMDYEVWSLIRLYSS